MRALVIVLLVGPAMAFANVEADNVIRDCLKNWGTHPFDAKNPTYRTISTKVKVLGIGGNVEDNEQTEKPELVLVKPGVAVMAKTVYNLKNQNGWYCMKGKVSVLGKIEINMHCKAKLASSGDGAEVLGASDQKSNGVSVLGSVRVNRGCN